MPVRDTTSRAIAFLEAFWFLRDFQIWIPVWIVYLTQSRGFSFTQVTVAEGLYLVGVVVLEVPTGAFADRAGRSRSLAVGALCLCGSVVLFAFVQDFGLLIASFLLWSFASTLTSGADLALLFETLKGANREGEYERLTGMATALNWGGIGIATLVGGPLAAVFGIRFTIFVGAATCLVTAAVAVAIPEPRHVVVRGEARPGQLLHGDS